MRGARTLKYPDFRMIGRLNVLAFDHDLFEQLFARTETGEPDLDILVRNEAGKADQGASQIEYPDGLAHIQYKDLGTLAHRGRLQNQLHCFSNGHEVAAHVGVGNGDWPAGRNLLLKERNNASVAAQNIPKADRNELGSALAGRHGRDDQLRNTFRNAHDARGIDGFIGGDHQEVGYLVAVGGLHDVPRPNYVIGSGLQNVRLHHGHVLICGGMKDRIHLVAMKDLVDPDGIAHIAEFGDHVHRGKGAVQFLLDAVELTFGLVEYDDGLGLESGYLPAYFGPNGTGAACYQDHSGSKSLADAFLFQLNRLPAQQVVYGNISNLGAQDFPS